jgi:hypothetical protein
VKAGRQWILELNLLARGGPAQVSFAGLKREAIKLTGVSLKDMKAEPRQLTFWLTEGASNRQANLQIPVLCNSKPITLKLILDLSKVPVENGSVPVKLTK